MDKQTIIKYYGSSTLISAVLVALVGWKLGASAMILALVLALLEITFSFDNAVINAKILAKMTKGWQQAFIWFGIPVAVFGVRVFLPLVIVSLISGETVPHIADLAINDPETYGHKLENAHYMISSFGGVFLLMLALDFFFEHKQVRWLKRIESIMIKAGTMESLTVIIGILAIFAGTTLVSSEHDKDVLIAGLIGMLVYLLLRAMNVVLARSGVADESKKTLKKASKHVFRAGLIGFIYLQVVDASFSLDSVIGAFAITKDILIIAIGLGVGAIYVRSMTIHMLRSKALDNYRYMEHGAHYAIALLAIIMIASLKYEVPEYITGLSGVVVIGASIWNSVHEKRTR